MKIPDSIHVTDLRQDAAAVLKKPLISSVSSDLFVRVASILEQARGNVVRSVNTNMVFAYWMIGREIMLELQGGEGRAQYGKRLIESLSQQLTERFGSSFSEQSLQNFRRFYQVFPERIVFPSPLGRESGRTDVECQIPYPVGQGIGR